LCYLNWHGLAVGEQLLFSRIRLRARCLVLEQEFEAVFPNWQRRRGAIRCRPRTYPAPATDTSEQPANAAADGATGRNRTPTLHASSNRSTRLPVTTAEDSRRGVAPGRQLFGDGSCARTCTNGRRTNHVLDGASVISLSHTVHLQIIRSTGSAHSWPRPSRSTPDLAHDNARSEDH